MDCAARAHPHLEDGLLFGTKSQEVAPRVAQESDHRDRRRRDRRSKQDVDLPARPLFPFARYARRAQ